MRILVIGSGGREHALVWKLRQSPRVSKIWCAPGNAGIADIAECPDIVVDDLDALLSFAVRERVDLTVVGPELPLTCGIVDLFVQNGLRIFGPSKAAAILEASKAFTKDFCERHHIPTAASRTFTDAHAARDYVHAHPLPLVIKADGLAAGKGVVICSSYEEAFSTLDELMVKHVLGDAGKAVVVEEFLEGEEVSFIAVCDGTHVLPLASAQDHKRVFDDDLGPNTGGMGAYSPTPALSAPLAQQALDEILVPTVRGMRAEGRPFMGALYAGLMICNGRPKLLEYNVRFGDPETQPLMMRLRTDIVEVFEAAIDGCLDRMTLEWDERPAACVVMAAGGYPGAYARGSEIVGLDRAAQVADAQVFHAGTSAKDGRIVTNGGRVLGVTALGADVREAVATAYRAVNCIHWEGCHYRRDIAHRAIHKMEMC